MSLMALNWNISNVSNPTLNIAGHKVSTTHCLIVLANKIQVVQSENPLIHASEKKKFKHLRVHFHAVL